MLHVVTAIRKLAKGARLTLGGIKYKIMDAPIPPIRTDSKVEQRGDSIRSFRFKVEPYAHIADPTKTVSELRVSKMDILIDGEKNCCVFNKTTRV